MNTLPERAGKKWMIEEDNMLLEAISKCEMLDNIASRHQRTLGSIRSRIIHIGYTYDNE